MRNTRSNATAAGVAVVALALTLGACSSSDSSSSTTAPTTGATGHSAKATAPATTRSGTLQGIVMAFIPGANNVTLLTLNPANGKISGPTTFTGGSATLAYGVSSSGLVGRQMFNAKLTETAATGAVDPDGGTTAGEVSLNHPYQPVTRANAGYSDTFQKSALGFDGAGNLWYYATNAPGPSDEYYGYVTRDLDEHLLSHHDWSANGMPAGLDKQAALVPVGRGKYEPYPNVGLSDAVFLPNGTEVRRDPTSLRYAVGPAMTLTVDSPTVTTTGVPPEGLPFMVGPVDSHRFLAIGPSSSPSQIYVGTLAGGKVQLNALLPEVHNRTVGSMVVSPDRTKVAFVSTDAGGSSQVYVTSLSSSGDQPRLLWNFPFGARPATYDLLDWRN